MVQKDIQLKMQQQKKNTLKRQHNWLSAMIVPLSGTHAGTLLYIFKASKHGLKDRETPVII